MKRRGVFITIEGIDGTGKSAHAALLVRHLRRCGYRVTATREPGGTKAGEAIREMLLTRRGTGLGPMSELALMYAARAEHIAQVIRPALNAGRIVLSDRYNDASMAYQGFGRRLGIEAVRAFDRVVCRGVQPDLTLLIDLDPKAALKRTVERRTGRSRFEAAGLGFQSLVRAGYLRIASANRKRVKLIKGNRTVLEVQGEIQNIVDEWLASRRRSLRRSQGRRRFGATH